MGAHDSRKRSWIVIVVAGALLFIGTAYILFSPRIVDTRERANRTDAVDGGSVRVEVVSSCSTDQLVGGCSFHIYKGLGERPRGRSFYYACGLRFDLSFAEDAPVSPVRPTQVDHKAVRVANQSLKGAAFCRDSFPIRESGFVKGFVHVDPPTQSLVIYLRYEDGQFVGNGAYPIAGRKLQTDAP